MGNYALYLSNYWKTIETFNRNSPGIKTEFDPDSALQYADNWLEESSEYTRNDLDNSYNDIVSMYSEISVIESKNEFVIETQEKIKDIYDRYCDLYSLATYPKGTQLSFTETITKHLEYVSDGCEQLNDMLEQSQEQE